MEIKKGMRIRTNYGDVYTVMAVWDNAVYVYETWNVIHISNIRPEEVR